MLVTAALMLGVYTIVDAHSIALGALVGRAARRRSSSARRRRARPLLPLRVLRSRNVVGANAVQMLMVAGMLGMFFLAVLYLQRVLGYDAIATGTAFLPVSIAIGTLSLGFSARLNTRFGAARGAAPGARAIALGLALMARAPVDGSYVVDLLPAMVAARRRRRPGVPGADDARDVGRDARGLRARFGAGEHDAAGRRRARLSVLATIAAERTGGAGDAASLVAGYQVAFVVAAGLVFAALVVAVAVLRAPPREAVAEPPSPRLDRRTAARACAAAPASELRR